MGIFDQPLLGYSPALEPPGWDLLRDMLMRKIFQQQGNPYGFDPSAGRSMSSLWSGNGRGTFDPMTGSYSGSGMSGGTGMGSPGPGPMTNRMTPVLAGSGGQGGGGPLGWEWGNPNARQPQVVGRDAQGFSPMRGGDIAASHAIKNPMNRHMMLRALIGHLVRQKMKRPPQAPIPLGQDARGPVMPSAPRGPNPTGSPDTSGTGGIPRTVPGGTSRPPMATPTGTASPRGGGPPEYDFTPGRGFTPRPDAPGKTKGQDVGNANKPMDWGFNSTGWNLGNSMVPPADRPPDANPSVPAPPVYQGPARPGGDQGGEHYGPYFDGKTTGYDAPYMFQRAQTGPLGMDAEDGSYSVGVHGGTMTNFPSHPGTSLYVPWGSDFDSMVQQFLASFGDQGGGGPTFGDQGGSIPGGGGGAGGGGGFGFRRPRKVMRETGTGTTLGQDGYFDQPNNEGGRDFGMRSGDNPSSVGPYRAVPRPPGADATQWGNW